MLQNSISNNGRWGKGLKIFYAVQATGNWHMARATELLPYLQQYGDVDIFLSGGNSSLNMNMPVKYKSQGLSLFYGQRGGLDYLKMWKELNLKRVLREARDLPLEKYDVVLNDFDCITSLACRFKKIKSLNFGHQASFQSEKTPRPEKKDFTGEFILKNYAKAHSYLGLHFRPYDAFIYSPVLKESILNSNPVDDCHVTVYLSHYSDKVVANQLSKLTDVRFEIFSKHVKHTTTTGNLTFIPVSNKAFCESMLHSMGVITGAGFETPAEALYLGKKLLCLPILGQYEQWCNAAALHSFGVPVVKKIDASFNIRVAEWLNMPAPEKLTLQQSTADIVEIAINKALQLQQDTYQPHPLYEAEEAAFAF